MQNQACRKFILILFTLAILVTGVYTCAYTSETANFDIAADNNVQEIRRLESSQVNPIIRTEQRVTPLRTIASIRTSKRQGITGLYRTVMGLVLVEYAPRICNSHSEFMQGQYYLIQTTLDSVILFVQGQDGKK